MPDAWGIFILGLAYGATVCSLTCLPYLGTYLMGTGSGFLEGVLASLFFMSGKVSSYILLGGLAGFMGQVLTLGVGQQKMITGIALIGAALALPFMASTSCRQHRHKAGRRIPLLLLGMATSLTPCPPLAAILVLAAGQGTWLAGAGYGLVYGLGLALSPLLIIGGGLSFISEKIQLEALALQPYLRGTAMVIMIMMGMRVLI